MMYCVIKAFLVHRFSEVEMRKLISIIPYITRVDVLVI